MRTLVLSLLFLAVIPLASGSLKPELESEYWKDTGLDRAFAQTLISSALCHQSERYFDSCKAAILAGARLTGHASQFSGLRETQFPKRLEFEFLLSRVLEGASEALPEPMLLGKMITAQLQVFDRYAQIIPSSFLNLLLNGEAKTYYDLGIETEISAAGLFIFHVHPNTPASAVGLRANDRIVSINGMVARGLEDSARLTSLWTGRRDFALKLKIERNGHLIEVETRTGPVSLGDLIVNQVRAGGKTFAHLRLLRFGKNSCDRIESQLQAFQRLGGNLGGVVLDVRHNGGGIVAEGQCIAQLFMGKRPAIAREKIALEFPAALDFPMGDLPDIADLFGERSAFEGMPLVVLVDAFSKSMSEVVAGALQGYGRAWVVGERSYGKSLVQIGRQLPGNDKLRLMRSMARFSLPPDIARAEPGVGPDFNIPFARFASHDRRSFHRETDGNVPAPARQNRDQLRSCASRPGSAASYRQAVSSALDYSDEQLAFALALLSCAT